MSDNRKNTFYIATTRFNADTWKQNKAYRELRDFNGCLYGTPRISQSMQANSIVFVLEMLNIPRGHANAPGMIMGIGVIRNCPDYKKYRSIYKDHNYNRYVYIGKHRVDRFAMTYQELETLKTLETMVFCGKGHLKRGQGITRMPEKTVSSNKKMLLKYLSELFVV